MAKTHHGIPAPPRATLRPGSDAPAEPPKAMPDVAQDGPPDPADKLVKASDEGVARISYGASPDEAAQAATMTLEKLGEEVAKGLLAADTQTTQAPADDMEAVITPPIAPTREQLAEHPIARFVASVGQSCADSLAEASRAGIASVRLAAEDGVRVLQETTAEATRALRADTADVVRQVGEAAWPHLVESVGKQIDERIAGLAERVSAPSVAPPAAPIVVSRGESGNEELPVVRFTQRAKYAQFRPVILPTGEISLILNADPTEAMSHEITIPDVGGKVVHFGYSVDIPPGWLADITTAGVAGQRVHIATLYAGAGDRELVLSLRSNARSIVRAGVEAARMHLRRCVPAALQWTDMLGASDTVVLPPRR